MVTENKMENIVLVVSVGSRAFHVPRLLQQNTDHEPLLENKATRDHKTFDGAKNII